MLFLDMFERRTNWNNRDYRDYRDYRDHRARLKRRLRRRLSIGMTLLVCLLLVVGLGSVSVRVPAQPAQPIEGAPVLSAPIRLQGPADPEPNRDIQRLKLPAKSTGQSTS